MGVRRWPTIASRIFVALLALALAGAVVRAAGRKKFQDARAQLLEQFQSERQAQGLAAPNQRAALFKKYPTPEIGLVKPLAVSPGQTAPISLSGRFAERTAFLVDNDDVELVNPVASATGFKATLKTAPTALPGFASLHAFTPVSGAWARSAVAFVGTPSALTFSASNGWTVKLTPEARAFEVEGREARVPYRVDVHRAGEAQPFEKMSGTLRIGADDVPGESFHLSLQTANAGSAQAELEALQKKYFSDPQAMMKLSAQEQEALAKKMQALTDRMTKEMQAALADPAAVQRKEDEFGCRSLSFSVGGDGSLQCGRKLGTLRLRAASAR